jgi:Fic family protein
MPIQISSEQYTAILSSMRDFPGGASISDLLQRADIGFSKRTLQRRLDHLVEDGRLLPIGGGRSRKYLIPPEIVLHVRDDVAKYKITGDWLSIEGRDVREYVNRGLAERNPVGYKPDFLNSYQPNQSFYLPPDMRRSLADIGQVGLTDLPAGTYLRQVMDRLLIDLSWNSSRLEGNTYSQLETQHLIEAGEGARGKETAETLMILNHKCAIEMLADQAGEIGFNRYTVCNLHALLADGLLQDPAACGRVRSRAVGISGTVFHPLEVPHQIDERYDQILHTADAIRDPFEQAFFVMVHLPYLQPFEDVNKRVSRLAANIPLIRHNLCPLSFVDVEQSDYIGGLIGVYEQNRVEYLRDVFARAYQRSCARYSAIRESLGDPDPFRLRHRSEIGRAVREIVLNRKSRLQAPEAIRKHAAGTIPGADQAKFLEVTETEVSSLHEGNIARYRLRPAEYVAWKKRWE